MMESGEGFKWTLDCPNCGFMHNLLNEYVKGIKQEENQKWKEAKVRCRERLFLDKRIPLKLQHIIGEAFDEFKELMEDDVEE